jgi:DEAD/DEAH box helicase domain-containing protein
LNYSLQICVFSDIQLFLHQAIAIEAIRAGDNVAVSTATASGKSLVYNIPVLESVIENSDVVALYLFPTKVG